MRIEENKVFLFNFESAEMGGNCSFPIRAESREQAVRILQSCLGRFNAELAMEFPRVVPSTDIVSDGISYDVAIAPAGLAGILAERIDVLMKDLGAAELTPDAKAKTVKNWTELDYLPENYAQIVHELEMFASGAKTIPVQSKKK